MKLVSVMLVVGGSLLASFAGAQDAANPAYASPEPQAQPVYASPQPAADSGAPGTIKDRSAHDRPVSLSAQLYIPWVWGIGIGVRLGGEIPVVKDGFISSINDSFSIEPAFYFAYSSYYSSYGPYDPSLLRFTPAVAGLWNFHLKPNLAVYGMLSIGVEIQTIRWGSEYRDVLGRDANDTRARAFVELAGGVKWKFADKLALRAELGWYGPRAGISLDL